MPRPGRPAAALLALALLASPLAAQQAPIVLDADSTEFDRRNNHVVFNGIRIAQGPLVITADRAESSDLDFGDSTWEFSGNVTIGTGQGEIRSGSASVAFRDSRLASATAVGAPARFRREVAGGQARTVSGTAERIRFDTGAGEVVLTGQAMVRDGSREVSGGRLLYRLREDRLIASSDGAGDERVRIVIVPETGDPGGDAGPAPEPEQP